MLNDNKPLAIRMRPKTLDEILGQKEVKEFLNNLINNDTLVSMIFYGNPGTGKTTTARAFCNTSNINSIYLNATIDNKEKMIEAFSTAKRFYPTIVIIDEIHGLVKGKQDLLLPHLEEGDFYMIGCTTSNPFISINSALRSRCKLLEFKALNEDDLFIGLKNAISNKEGLNNNRKFDDEALKLLAKMSSGDLRFAYNQLEVISLSFLKDHLVTKDDIKNTIKYSNYLSDKDEHYNLISAFQKSIRGSDVNASLYYLARLLKNGDLDSIIRRLLVTAYEDIGLANPQAVTRTYQATETALKVGIHEGRIPLAFAVIDLALSPKSKSSEEGIDRALNNIEQNGEYPVREYLRNVAINKEDYDYSDPDLWKIIKYLPKEIEDTIFYNPKESTGKYEKALNENNKELSKNRKFDSINKARDYLKSKK